MNKYIQPTIEIHKLHSADVITVSSGVTYGNLKGVDTEESKTAIFDVNYWFTGI